MKFLLVLFFALISVTSFGDTRRSEGNDLVLDSKMIINFINETRNHLLEDNSFLKNEILNLKSQNEELKNKLILLSEDVASLTTFRDNTTDIWNAAKNGSLPAVKYFYKEDPSNVNKKNKNDGNSTPLHYASREGHFEIVQFLISKGAETDPVESGYMATPLIKAARYGHLFIVKYLLDNGANINHQTQFNDTPLQWAVSENYLDIVKLLCEKGADLNLKGVQDNTPLDLAKEKNFRPIIDYLSSLK